MATTLMIISSATRKLLDIFLPLTPRGGRKKNIWNTFLVKEDIITHVALILHWRRIHIFLVHVQKYFKEFKKNFSNFSGEENITDLFRFGAEIIWYCQAKTKAKSQSQRLRLAWDDSYSCLTPHRAPHRTAPGTAPLKVCNWAYSINKLNLPNSTHPASTHLTSTHPTQPTQLNSHNSTHPTQLTQLNLTHHITLMKLTQLSHHSSSNLNHQP